MKYPDAPGPLLARFTNMWQTYKMAKGNFHHDNIKMHDEYGKIVRTGPDSYSINDLAAAKIIYGHGTRFTKSDWYRVWDVPFDIHDVNLFAQQNIEQHATARRRYANLYAMSTLVGYEPHVNDCIQVLCTELADCCKTGENLDMGRWFQYYAFDVIGSITFSRPFGFMKSKTDVHGLIAALGNTLEVFQLVGMFPAIIPIHTWLMSAMSKSSNKLLVFANTCINEAKKNLLHGIDDESEILKQVQTPPDFCSKLLAMADNPDSKIRGGLAPDQLVIGSCLANIFAGSDTTSITLTATLFEILARPEVLVKLRAELDEASTHGQLSDPPTFQETQRLAYLQATLKEALRIHPATGLPLWRQVPSGGVTLCGTYFPPGTNVGVNSWVAHQNQEIWGSDAHTFRPERWIDAPEEKLREMNAFFMPFGLGSRTCIGKNISLLEISKVIPHLIRKFDLSLENHTLPARCAWFVKPHNCMVSIRMRGQ
ncbi:putative cytochrome P450 pisatin demethylase [Cryphonectria parasitica EP155]|uniref:Cytochrome P450 pisatin demethylase n=1 Tax=Cryphonectria parasitica (strain ATCC 38755 / EP155) TaxID=660469 RepID=A0A9P4XZA2_CRYP1|nr:putative cytochrome P450 pisatin demethylase [Cryphonectria parasitica EP155]KAF3764092.1 putative cytochrome P450 pisatin demethylase [Cryphonectria parasitica EP155]